MIIGIDGNEANIAARVGVNQYCLELLWALYKLQGEWKDKHTIIVYLSQKPISDMPKASSSFLYKIIPGKNLWIITKLMPNLFLGKPKPDVFFSPSHYVPPLAPMPRVCAIMDLGYLKFSGQFKKYDFWQLKLWSAYSIFVSKAIIAISTSTNKDIVRHYPSASKKVSTTLLAYDKDKFNLKINTNDVRRVRNKYHIVDDYILYISTLKPSKNVEGLLAAFALVSDKFPQLQLVIAGKRGWMYETIFEKAKKLRIEEKVVFTDYFPEEERPALMAGAKLYVLPSFWEGFGIEVLNAMACGIPVVASKAGSLPEVVGDAGILVDPYRPKDIARGIMKVLLMGKTDYNSLVGRGLRHVKGFSWQKTARKTLKILESV